MAADLAWLSRRWEALRQVRRPWDSAWRDLAVHFLPTRCRLGDGPGRPLLNGKLVDATGVLAMRTLVAGLHGGMTSPARPWFRLSLHDSELAGHPVARTFLDEVAARMRVLLQRSNFYNAMHNVYGDLGAFGTAFMFQLPDRDRGFRFLPLTAGEYVLDVDQSRRVDTVFRRFRMTARQLAQTFERERLPEVVCRALNNPAQQESFHVLHAVYPREDDQKSGSVHSCVSVYWMEGSCGRRLLRKSGFESFPGFGPRWDCAGDDVYGRSPAMDALPDCRMLQQMSVTTLKGIHKAVDPPMSVSASLKAVGLDLTPGGINYVESAPGQSPQAAAPLLSANPDLAQARQAIEAVQKQVRAGLYNDLFRLIMDGRNGVTAREIAAREEEKLILIGPVLERLHDELFTPLIDRTFLLMRRMDMLPPTPPELQNRPLRVEFVSLLAQAQKLVTTAAVDQYLNFAMTAAKAWPETLDSVDIDRIADSYAEYLGLETGLLRPLEERRELRAARREAIARREAAQQVGEMVSLAKSLGDVNVKEGSALGELGRALGGAALPAVPAQADDPAAAATMEEKHD